MTTNQTLKNWVDEAAQLTQADNIYWCNGSDQEFDAMANRLESEGGFSRLNPDTHPNCWLHRSDPSDVARVEHCTFVCTSEQDDAGPNNNWMAPELARARMEELFRGCMKGRTMYVIPYCMGPIDSPLSRCGVEITDSAYVVCNMKLMTRMGDPALRRIEREGPFLRRLLDAAPDRSVLDLGCGTGEHTAFFADEGARAVGVDRSEAMLTAARDHEAAGRGRFLEGDLLHR